MMATSEILKNYGEKPGSSRPCPIPIAAVETAATIALKTSAAPLPSAPLLSSLPTPASTSTPSSRFVLSQPYPENQQNVQQPYELPHLSTGMPRQQYLPTQQITAITDTKQKSSTKNNYDRRDLVLRSGKWTAQEELYANILIELFEEGCVDEFEQNNNNNNDNSEHEKERQKYKITNGMTLRAYLSQKLFCSPMRISKKFAGRGIGKLVYTSQSPSTYQRNKQRFPLCSGQISSNRMIPLPSAAHWNKFNRLKEAESDFLKVAFPRGDPMNVRTNGCSTLMKATTPFAASSSARKRSSPIEAKVISSKKSSPNKDTLKGAYCSPLAMKDPLTVNDRTPANNKLVYHRHHEQSRELHCTTTGESNPAQATTTFSCETTGIIYTNGRATELPNYDNTASPSEIISSSNPLHQQHSSPLMAAPKLLSPNPNSKKTHHENLMPTSWTPENNHRTQFVPASQLQRMQCELKTQQLQAQNQSQIEVLKEAYLNSVSLHKPPVPENVNANSAMIAASPKLPSQLVHNNATRHGSELHQQRSTDPMQMLCINQSTPGVESGRIMACQMTSDFSKHDTKTPNLLSGFDKVSEQRPSSPFDRSAPNNTACDLQQFAQNSPAYHTSKSFDDFHRFLGKGLSPTILPPKFSNRRVMTAGPAIPSVQFPNEASMPNLQMRPRNLYSLGSAVISSDTISSKSCAPIGENASKENRLSTAYAEAIKSSQCQQVLRTPEEVGNTNTDSSDRCNGFARNPAVALSQYSAYALSDQSHQHKPDGALDFPIEGMMFEDFDTLASYSDATIELSSPGKKRN